MKYTQSVVDKLEDILGESGYVVRYERGTFQSGWCLLEARKVVVLNKFLNTEGRINTLMEIIPQLTIEFDKLTLESQKLYEEIVKKSVTEA
jgi:flavodoxin